MDILIKNAVLITGLEEKADTNQVNIGINEGKITYIGPEDMSAERIIDAKGKTAMPGLFNAHTHTSMILMRNSVADKNLEAWLSESIFPIENKLTAEYIRNASLLAMAEMIKSGTVGFLDMYYFVEETAEAVLEVGMRANISKGILTSGSSAQDYEASKKHCLAFHRNYDGAGNGLLKTSLEVHSVYLYDERELRESADFAREYNMRVHSHLHETASEVSNSIEKYGKKPIEVFDDCGLLEVPVTAAHCIYMSEYDIDLAKSSDFTPVHCPSSNMYLASGFSPVHKMIEKGLVVGLGTDGAASNNTLDMFREMHLAGLIHKGVLGDASVMNASSVIKMATGGSASATGFKESGTIEVGKNADIILIDNETVHNTPLLNPVNAVVYSTKGSDVDTVIVNGRILMKDKNLLTIDEEKVRFNVNQIAEYLY